MTLVKQDTAALWFSKVKGKREGEPTPSLLRGVEQHVGPSVDRRQSPTPTGSQYSVRSSPVAVAAGKAQRGNEAARAHPKSALLPEA